MAMKSKTYKTSGFPLIKPHYFKTVISDGNKSRSGVGKTAEQSQAKAKRNWNNR